MGRASIALRNVLQKASSDMVDWWDVDGQRGSGGAGGGGDGLGEVNRSRICTRSGCVCYSRGFGGAWTAPALTKPAMTSAAAPEVGAWSSADHRRR
jgi:hypothetical protein